MCKVCDEIKRFYESVDKENEKTIKVLDGKKTPSSIKGKIEALLYEKRWTHNHKFPRIMENTVKFIKEGRIGFELNFCPECGKEL